MRKMTMTRELKVGGLVLTALAVLAAAIFLLGERRNLFVLKAHYSISFPNVSGLAEGNPVKLNGVTVGQVERVVLPERIEEELLTVWISLDRRFASRVRADSLARIKTLGLLGDKYVEISSGSPTAEIIQSRGEIPAAPATDVDRLITSGEDVVDNVVAISYSLRTILQRMQRGEGLLGELLTDDEAGKQVRKSVVGTLHSVESITARIERGEGTLGALLTDDDLARRAEEAVAQLEVTLSKLNDGEGTLAALLGDEELRTDVETLVSKSSAAAVDLSHFTSELRQGSGLAQRLLTDEEYSEKVTENLLQLLENLSSISKSLREGEGTLGQFINDPHLYQALDDVVVGINESKMLRRLVRNRQRAGIEKRYREATAAEKGESGRTEVTSQAQEKNTGGE
jgi:phospholipid/cholesterol/gamma-HCH transport system substrate-binding protein